MSQPKVIFLDAVGTLFGVRGSVGEVYSQLARQFGVELAAPALDRAFYQSFKAASPCAFPGIDPLQIPACEYDWWQAIAVETFETVGALAKFSDFDGFFAQLYLHFSGASPWFVYSDVRRALEYWQQQGVELGVISNFDSRLYAVLDALDLAGFFTSVTLSTEVGAAKPDGKIFTAALAKHHCKPEAAWHIGDSEEADWKGAKAVGIRGIWLRR